MHAPPGQVPCSYHPNVQTGLRCTRCGKPICPQCAVRTPVGLRCPECAGTRRTAAIRTPANELAKAVGGAALVAVAVAVLWRFLPEWGFYLSLAMGFGVVETIARFTRDKRGVDLQLIAIGVITVGFLLSRVLLAQRFGVSLADINALNDSVFTDAVRDEFGRPMPVSRVLRLQAAPDLLYMAIAYAIAWVRFR